jgi:hypothetical protein
VSDELADLAAALADLTAAIKDAALCWRCLALKTGQHPERLYEVMVALRQSVAVVLSLALCDSCQRDALLYSLRQPEP